MAETDVLPTVLTSYRQLAISVPAAEIRQVVYSGRQHVVVPVCALTGDQVIHSMNAEKPEFVPADLLAQAPTGWNNRPVVPLHPDDGTANTPEVLEAMCFGTIFNSSYDPISKKLKMEAWLDPQRADAVGALAQDVIARCNRGEMVEVSIGAIVGVQGNIEGEANGKPYSGVWVMLVPDHLAMLPAGVKGACSIEMGCGGPRLLSAHSPIEGDKTPNKENDMSAPASSTSLIERAARVLTGLFKRTAAGADGESDQDLRYKISCALHDTVAGFDWLREVYPATSRVIYDVYREREWSTWSCTYTMSGDSVTLTDHVEVIAEVVYTPKKKEQDSDDAATTEERSACGCTKTSPTSAEQGGAPPCACHGGSTPSIVATTDEHAALSTLQAGDTTMNTKEKVERLLGLVQNADRRTLEALPEAALDAAIAAAEAPKEGASATASTATSAATSSAPATVTPATLAATTPTPAFSESQLALLAAAEAIVNRDKEQRIAFLAANTAIPADKLRTKSEKELALLEESLGGPDDGADSEGGETDFSGARVAARKNADAAAEAEANAPLSNVWTRSLAAEAKGASN